MTDVLSRPAEGEAAAAEIAFRPVAEGLWTARLPLPFRLNHVNVALLDGPDGWTLVDCGIGTEDGLALWEDLLQRLPDSRPITRILVTHYHPDHVGAAGWLAARTGAPLVMTEAEWLTARALLGQSREVWEASARAYWTLTGLDADTQALLAERGTAYRRQVQPLPPAVQGIAAGTLVPCRGGDWQSFTVSGHSPAQLCLVRRDASMLLPGDHLLPRISPNVSTWATDPLEDPLADFQRTLRRFTALPASMAVLPCHGPQFTDPAARAQELLEHHEERLALLVTHAAAQPGFTVQDAVRVLFRPGLDAHQTGFAVGEALAHLNRLVATARLARHLDGGVWRFFSPSAAGTAPAAP